MKHCACTDLDYDLGMSVCRSVRGLLSLCLLRLLICCAPGQTPIWTQLPNSPSGTSPRFDDVYFVNESTGWTARSTGGIYKTTDAGNTWVQQVPNLTNTHFRCIGFASATRGWAGNLGPGSYDASVTDTNVMYETFDGGLTWSNHPGFAEAGMKGLCSLHVFDSQHIFGVGRVRGPAYFIKTTNGGTTWTITNLTAAGVMGAMMDVYFKDLTNGFVVGMNTNIYADSCSNVYHGRIARTTDGGATWTPVATTTLSCCYFWKMAWPTPSVGYASLQFNGSSSTHVFYKTVDGGATWTSNGVPYSVIGIPSFYWQGVGFISATEGWAGGDSNTSPYADNFLHTTDGGLSWTPVGYTNSVRINRIRFLSPTVAYGSGGKLHVFRVPLSITNQPLSQWVSPGASVTFTVGAYGNPPFSFQWQKNGAAISGATTSALTLTNLTRAQEAAYSVVVTNAWGALTSSNASLRVVAPQYIQTPQLAANGMVDILFGDSTGAPLSTNDLPNMQVLSSSNLVDWIPLTNALSLTNGMLMFQETATLPRRFYRVLEH
jgi:photosystem II stability/assembly factor-like uncharacterized protein